MSTSPLVWFLLLDSATGKPYKGTTVSSVLRSSLVVPVIDQFRDAVKKKDKDDGEAAILTPFKSSQLLVYRNKAAFDKRNAQDGNKEEPLKSSCSLNDLGQTEENALMVVVPSTYQGTIPMDIDEKSSPFVRKQSDEAFIQTQHLDITKSSGAKAYLKHLFQKFLDLDSEQLKAKANASHFLEDTCLEFQLGHRMTTYNPDEEDNIKVLLAVSGAGKTRTLLELLYHSPGYYFTANPSSDFGSQDLLTCKNYSDQHTESVKHAISLLYCIRKFVCSYVQETLGVGNKGILLAQLHPKQFFGLDIYTTLFEALINDPQFDYNFEQKSFGFFAIDEIQDTLKIDDYSKGYVLSSENKRSFFSPLIYHSKMTENISQFLLSGTGINYPLLRDALKSISLGAKSGSNMTYQTVSALEPLKWEQMQDFTTRFLSFHQVINSEITTLLSRIQNFQLCHGRARFLAFIVEYYLETRDIDCALREFAFRVHDVTSVVYPLRFVVEDVKTGKFLERTIDGRDLELIVMEAMYSYLTSGTGTLNIFGDDAPLMITYGIGFGTVASDVITRICIKELAVIHCLRKFVPFFKIIQRFAASMDEALNPQTAGYLLEYLVAYAVVARYGGPGATEGISPFMFSPSNYLGLYETEGFSKICFPDHLCGPDIIYKCFGTKTVYMIQAKFLKSITRQELVAACDTTDYERFYCKRNASKPEVLPGFAVHQRELRESVIGLLKNHWKIQQVVVLHAGKNAPTYARGVHLVTEVTEPGFFDDIHPRVWGFLNRIRSQFSGDSGQASRSQ